MSVRLIAESFSGTLAERLAAPRPARPTLHWLGQAGFVVDAGPFRLVIDPYLSDALAEKYAGSATPHPRMMPVPATPEELGPVDLVLVTHHHTDHMDGATLAPLARLNPRLRFLVPAAALAQAAARIGGEEQRLIGLDAGQSVEPLPGVVVHAVRAAHETLERDAAGRHLFLGYAISCGGFTLFHSGDTIPFEGQVAEVAALAPDVALLPVNGCSQALRQAGIAGNFTVGEAAALCEACAIPAMIAHHYGMFAFNTADPAVIDAAAASVSFTLLRARTRMAYGLVGDGVPAAQEGSNLSTVLRL